MTVPRAAALLGWGKDRVRRGIESGRLAATTDPLLLRMAKEDAGGRGRPPEVLVSLDSVHRELAEQRDAAPAARPLDEFFDRLSRLEALVGAQDVWLGPRERELNAELERLKAELARTRAELAKTREVARLAIERSRRLSEADRIGQDQIIQFLTQDFPND